MLLPALLSKKKEGRNTYPLLLDQRNIYGFPNVVNNILQM